MMIEGKGLVSPKPAEITITRPDLERLREIALIRDQTRGYLHRADQWGRGLTNSPILIGLMGELALCYYLNSKLQLSLDVDARDLPCGDGGKDLSVFGYHMQVKTRQRRGSLLVRRYSESGNILPMDWHFCIASTWRLPDFPSSSVVCLDGWVSRERILTYADFVGAYKGRHMNLELPDNQLQSMTDLARFLGDRRTTRTA